MHHIERSFTKDIMGQLACRILLVLVDVMGEVDDGDHDEAECEERPRRVQRCPRYVSIPAPADVERLQRQEEEEDGGRKVDERGLLEALGQIGALGVPGQVGVPQGIAAEGSHSRPRPLSRNEGKTETRDMMIMKNEEIVINCESCDASARRRCGVTCGRSQSQNAIVLPEHLGHHVSDARREIVSMRTRPTSYYTHTWPTHHLFASEIHSKVAIESAQTVSHQVHSTKF